MRIKTIQLHKTLCDTCRYGQVMRHSSNIVVVCEQVTPSVRVSPLIESCSAYEDKRQASQYEMEKIAWTVSTDKSGNKIGFKPPSKRD